MADVDNTPAATKEMKYFANRRQSSPSTRGKDINDVRNQMELGTSDGGNTNNNSIHAYSGTKSCSSLRTGIVHGGDTAENDTAQKTGDRGFEGKGHTEKQDISTRAVRSSARPSTVMTGEATRENGNMEKRGENNCIEIFNRNEDQSSDDSDKISGSNGHTDNYRGSRFNTSNARTVSMTTPSKHRTSGGASMVTPETKVNGASPSPFGEGDSNESSTEPSSINTSHNSDFSTGSSASEANVPSAEPLSFSDPRQRQVFEALTGIQALRKGGLFSDLTVRVKDQEFRCHKFILSNSSQFFHDLINKNDNNDENSSNNNNNNNNSNSKSGNNSNDSIKNINNSNDIGGKGPQPEGTWKGSQWLVRGKDLDNRIGMTSSENSVLVLAGLEPYIFDKVLDFVYCVFDDVISDKTALELLLAADTFKLGNLSQSCVAHIAETVSVDNVYDVITLVDSGCTALSNTKVRLRCHQVFRENFLHLCCKAEFLGLTRTRMISLVADSMLAIKGEADLIQPLLRWVNVRPSERCADLTLMLQLIRFPLMSSEELDKLLDISLLRENSLASALIEESRAYGLKDFPDRMAWARQNCISRCHFSSRDFILWTADRNKGLHLYSIIDGLHYKVTTFHEAAGANAGFTLDSSSTVCCYGERLFFTGGEFNTDLAWSVDCGTGEVSVHAKMPRGRKFHSMVVSQGCVYCLGGQDKRGYTVLDSVDAYIVGKDYWLKVGHMAVAAYSMAAVASGGAIYLIGGVDHSGQSLRVIQCFAVLRSGLYSAFKVEVSNMPPSLLSARAVTSGLDGSVYIVCGHGEVYRFDVEKQCLEHVNTLTSLNQNPRVRFGLAHVGGCLVVIGGHQLGLAMHEPIKSVCVDIATKAEVKDYSPKLPADIVNTCFYAKLNSGILGFSDLSTPKY